MTTYRVCFCYRRNFRPASKEPPEAIKALYRRYSDHKGVMSRQQFRKFLIEAQGEKEDFATKLAEEIIKGDGGGGISLDAFFRYLFGDKNAPLQSNIGVQQDMSCPLSHYFIFTGHNSYLTGNQLNSDCSEVPIVKALERGVRVIELDMWPNSTKDNINILHGRTLTTPVDLMKCLVAIKEHAFSVSPFPVILTLEDHLPPHLQAKVAQMLKETFGEMLYVPNSEPFKQLPSPEELKMKIIVSTKPPKEYLEAKVVDAKEPHEEEKLDRNNNNNNNDEDNKLPTNNGTTLEDDVEDVDVEKEQKANQNVEYKHLIAIPVRKRKGGFDDFFRIEPDKVTRLSLSEQSLEKAVLTHAHDIIRFAEKNLVRIFPKTTRFLSSNYNPLVGWLHGAQMVAFNMQGYGSYLWLMQGLFRGNGGCGYVKKPDFLLKFDEMGPTFDPKTVLPVKKTLKVKVFMGDGWHLDFHQSHFDTYSPPDFYARVGIEGVPGDTIMKRTRTIEDKWTPIWDEEFNFGLSVPEMALVRIEVHEFDVSDKDDFAGQTCLPISELRSGIRALPLFDRKGDQLPSVKLLVGFEFV